MRAQDHDIADAEAFLRATLAVCPSDFVLELEGSVPVEVAIALTPFAMRPKGLLGWLQPTRYSTPVASAAAELNVICTHIDSMRLTHFALRSSDTRVTWFEAFHFGDDRTIFVHDDFPETLAQRLRDQGIAKLSEAEQ